MILHKLGRVWWADCSYSEKDLAKAARFRWHGGNCWPNCFACAEGLGKVWWTPKAEQAALLAQYAADPAVRAELSGLAEQREKALADSRAVDADIDVPCPEGLAYYPFQKAGIAYASQRSSTLLADEMGLGKSVEAIGLINADPTIQTVLCVVPATLRINWKREAEKWLVRPLRVQVIEKREPIEEGAQFVIVNYDKVIGKAGAAFREQVFARTWDLLIVDEAHRVKNPQAQRTKIILGKRERDGKKNRGLLEVCKRRLFLTGTPILNRPIEIHPILSAIAPTEFGNFMGFAKRYCGAHKAEYGWDFSGATNLEELQQRLRATCMVRRLKRDVLTELPPKTRQVVPVAVNGSAGLVEEENTLFRAHVEQLRQLRAEVELAHAKGGEEAYLQAVANLRDAAKVAFEEISRARHDLAVAKVPAVIEHVQDILEQGQKVIVFAHHHDVVDALTAAWGSLAVEITGRTPQGTRQEIVDRFQNDDGVRVFVGSITAAGVGITLTASSIVVFAELDWVPANITQAEDRAHRIGQSGNVLVQHLVLDGSLDARMAKTIVAKQTIADRALDIQVNTTLPVLPLDDDDEKPDLPKKYPEATLIEKQTALRGLQLLAGVCDGARLLDGAGFNRVDTYVGKRLAAESELTDGQVWLAKRLLRKYHRQLPKVLLVELGIEVK